MVCTAIFYGEFKISAESQTVLRSLFFILYFLRPWKYLKFIKNFPWSLKISEVLFEECFHVERARFLYLFYPQTIGVWKNRSCKLHKLTHICVTFEYKIEDKLVLKFSMFGFWKS